MCAVYTGALSVPAATVRGVGGVGLTSIDAQNKPGHPVGEEAGDAFGEGVLQLAPADRGDRFFAVRCQRNHALILFE
jgi:hypothetical protein